MNYRQFERCGLDIYGPPLESGISFNATPTGRIEVLKSGAKAFTARDHGEEGGAIQHNMLQHSPLNPGESVDLTSGVFTGKATANNRAGITYNGEPINL